MRIHIGARVGEIGETADPARGSGISMARVRRRFEEMIGAGAEALGPRRTCAKPGYDASIKKHMDRTRRMQSGNITTSVRNRVPGQGQGVSGTIQHKTKASPVRLTASS